MAQTDKKRSPLLGKAVVSACTCSHAFQDKEHGKGQRVHSICVVAGGKLGRRCSVCSSEKEGIGGRAGIG
jgi:hypothetical protein